MCVHYIQPLHMVFKCPYNHHMWGVKQSEMYFITVPSELIAPKLHSNRTRIAHGMKQGEATQEGGRT
jgi:hypothetical protein